VAERLCIPTPVCRATRRRALPAAANLTRAAEATVEIKAAVLAEQKALPSLLLTNRILSRGSKERLA